MNIKYIALLRGINVGGHNKIKMTDLKNMMENLGFEEIQTYIQSGNIIFMATKTEDISKAISDEILRVFGLKVPCIVLKKQEFESIINSFPYLNHEKTKQLYINYLSVNPEHKNKCEIEEIDFPDHEFEFSEKALFLKCLIPYHESKLNSNFLEKKLKVTVTTRNYTVSKALLALLNTQ